MCLQVAKYAYPVFLAGRQALLTAHASTIPANKRTQSNFLCTSSLFLHETVNFDTASDLKTPAVLQVAKYAYPVFLARCQALLTAYASSIPANTELDDRRLLGETLCVLEVCSSMTLSAAVVDAACDHQSPLQVSLLTAVCTLCSAVTCNSVAMRLMHDLNKYSASTLRIGDGTFGCVLCCEHNMLWYT